jgi:hypothetical protein
MLSVANKAYAYCRSAECHYAECRAAKWILTEIIRKNLNLFEESSESSHALHLVQFFHRVQDGSLVVVIPMIK